MLHLDGQQRGALSLNLLIIERVETIKFYLNPDIIVRVAKGQTITASMSGEHSKEVTDKIVHNLHSEYQAMITAKAGRILKGSGQLTRGIPPVLYITCKEDADHRSFAKRTRRRSYRGC